MAEKFVSDAASVEALEAGDWEWRASGRAPSCSAVAAAVARSECAQSPSTSRACPRTVGMAAHDMAVDGARIERAVDPAAAAIVGHRAEERA